VRTNHSLYRFGPVSHASFTLPFIFLLGFNFLFTASYATSPSSLPQWLGPSPTDCHSLATSIFPLPPPSEFRSDCVDPPIVDILPYRKSIYLAPPPDLGNFQEGMNFDAGDTCPCGIHPPPISCYYRRASWDFFASSAAVVPHRVTQLRRSDVAEGKRWFTKQNHLDPSWL